MFGQIKLSYRSVLALARLNVRNRLVFLLETLPKLLEDIPLQLWQDMWFDDNDIPSHYTVGVRVRQYFEINIFGKVYMTMWLVLKNT